MKQIWVSKLLIGSLALVLGGCERAAPEISFAAEIFPIFEKHCLECHRREAGRAGYEASGFSMESYEALMRGTQFGPVVVPGDSLSSVLTTLIEGRADPSIAMPHGDRPPLDPSQIEAIKEWVDQGAKNN